MAASPNPDEAAIATARVRIGMAVACGLVLHAVLERVFDTRFRCLSCEPSPAASHAGCSRTICTCAAGAAPEKAPHPTAPTGRAGSEEKSPKRHDNLNLAAFRLRYRQPDPRPPARMLSSPPWLAILCVAAAGCGGMDQPSGPHWALPVSSSEGDVGMHGEPSRAVILRGSDPVAGDLYLLAGPELGSADVYVVRDGPLRAAQRLTKTPAGRGVSAVTAADDRVVVAAAWRNRIDEIEELDLTGGATLPGRHIGPGSLPALAPDGALAYVRNTEDEDGRLASALMVERDGKAVTQTVRRSLFEPLWIETARLAVHAGRRHLLVDPGTSAERMRALPARTGYRVVGRADGSLAQATRRGIAVFRLSGRPVVRISSRWLPMAWHPSRRTLLVSDRAGTRLGLANVRTGRVKAIGRVQKGAVHGAAWTP